MKKPSKNLFKGSNPQDNLEKKFIETRLKSRTKFIAHRVIGIQALLLLLTGALTSLFMKTDISMTIIIYIVPVGIIMILIAIRFLKAHSKKMIYESHWSSIVLPLFVIWICITLPIGLLFDINRGINRTFIISFFLAITYLIGYGFALNFWKLSLVYSKRSVKILLFVISLLLIFSTLVLGLFSLYTGFTRTDFSLNEQNSGNLLANPFFDLGIHLMLSGISIVLSMLLNRWMLISLGTSEISNIQNSSPNYLIAKFLLRTVILMFIFWICFQLFFPPIGGGGDDDDSGGSNSNSTNNKSIQARRRKRKLLREEKKEEIQQQWKKYIPFYKP